MKNTKKTNMNKKLRFKDIYVQNKNRKLNEIVKINSDHAKLIADPKKVIIKNRYKIIISVVIVLALLISAMYNDILTLLITLAFLIGISLIVCICNTFKFICNKDGINVSFGFQKAFFPYDKIKCIYLSKYDDYSFLHIVRDYNIVLKYEDLNGFIKELSFSTLFVTPTEVKEFLNNFVTENKNSSQEIKFERFKFLKKAFKIFLLLAFIGTLIAVYFLK